MVILLLRFCSGISKIIENDQIYAITKLSWSGHKHFGFEEFSNNKRLLQKSLYLYLEILYSFCQAQSIGSKDDSLTKEEQNFMKQNNIKEISGQVILERLSHRKHFSTKISLR